MIALRVPRDVITAKCAPYRHHGKPWHRPGLQNLDDYDIVSIYGAEYRGIVNYYLLARDVMTGPAAPHGADVDAEDPGCAMRRTAISPAKRAEMRGDISGSDGLLGSKGLGRKIAWQETGSHAQAYGVACREIRTTR